MHIVCSKDNLLKGFQAVSKAVASRTILPILSNVLFDCTEDSKLKLSATDLEIGVEAFVETQVLTPGKITIPARALHDIITKLPADEVDLKTNESGTETSLKCGRSRYNLKSIVSDDFPPLPQIEIENSIFLNAELLSMGIRKTIFASSSDTAKNVLNGVKMLLADGKLEMAATDGYRLAVKKLPIESKNEQGFSVIVPSRALNELSRLLNSPKDEMVAISQLSNQLVFSIDDKILSTRLIEGQYPDYNRIIPNNLDKEIVFDRVEFLNTVDRVAAISSIDKVNIIKLEIKSGEVNFSSSTPELGQSSESIEIEYEGDNFEINFNARFLMDGLKNFEEEKIRFQLGGSLSPGLLKGMGDETYFCMIMPIRS
jgi:DNA polymerase-3 subunit beta